MIKQVVHIRVTPEVHTWLQKKAVEKDVTVSTLGRWILSHYMDIDNKYREEKKK